MKQTILKLTVFASGFASGVVYVASCAENSATAGLQGAASEVTYDNTTSGLASVTVQGAIDEIGTTVRAAVSPPSNPNALATPTVWSGEVARWDGQADTLVTTTGYTVQFTETAANEGTYDATPSNIMMKDTNSVLPTTGKYWLVGNQLIVSCANPGGGLLGFAWRVDVARGGHEMTFADGTVATRLTRSGVAQ